jgi:hypothetical protein
MREANDPIHADQLELEFGGGGYGRIAGQYSSSPAPTDLPPTGAKFRNGI